MPAPSPKWQRPATEATSRRTFGFVVGAVCLIAGAVIGVQVVRSTSKSPRGSARTDAVAATAAEAPRSTRPTRAAAAPTPAEPPAIVVPSAAPVASASVAPIDLDFDEAGARATLAHGAVAHEWATAENAFDTLAEKAPAAFKDHQVALSARDLAVGLEKEGAGEKVFDRLAHRLDQPGIDILYLIVESRGGSKAASRASELLRETEVLKRATPELRVAFELREAPCEKKGDLLERAGKEGDVRTLVVLKTMTSSCFKKSKSLAQAIVDVTERVKRTGGDVPRDPLPVPPHAHPHPKTTPRAYAPKR